MRKNWSKYFMDLADQISEQSTCIRRKVGAIAVRDKRILATGFNGAPAGLKHCSSGECYRTVNNIPSGKMHELCKAVHAEQNIITQAAKYGISLEGATIYVTTSPCSICLKLMINVGIKKVVVGTHDYPDDFAKAILREAQDIIEVSFMELGVNTEE